MRIWKAAALYYALVFGAGFILGTFRVLLVVPRFGTRIAELIEEPTMLLVTIFAARWVVGRIGIPSTRSARLRMGCIALAFMLVSEFALVLWVRGMTIHEYLASRDPVSGTVYYALLGLFCHHAASGSTRVSVPRARLAHFVFPRVYLPRSNRSSTGPRAKAGR